MSGKQRNLRKKRTLEKDEPQGDEVLKDNLADVQLLQRTRKRAVGIRADAVLAAGPADLPEPEEEDNELMDAYVKEQKTQTALLDEDAHMQKYVEAELAKRLGKKLDEGEGQLSKAEQEELELYRVPEGLQATLKKEVVIPGSLTAITEVEVSKEAKLRKIEETEAMKARLLAAARARRAGANADMLEEDLAAGAGFSGRGIGAGGSGAPSATGAVRRGMFAFNFGKQKQKALPEGVDDEELRRRRRVISERYVDPRDVAAEAARKARASGGRGGS